MNRTSAPRLAATLFGQLFSTRPVVVASAPGRVNLIGEHTDYNGGPVLPVALERRTAVAASHGEDWMVASAIDGKIQALDVDGPLRKAWTDYIVGVVRELRPLRAAPAGAHLTVATTLPIGAGLSSSAALTVAAAKALSLLAGRRLTPAQLADVAYRAEHDQVGVLCGRMDQTVAAHGQRGTALLFETATGSIRPVPFGSRLWVVETGISHKLTGGALNDRRRECEEALAQCRTWYPGLTHLAQLTPGDLPDLERRLPPGLFARSRHVITETARTRAAAAALASGDLATLGRLLVEGHESLRVDYGSTIPEADFIVESAVARGAYGARLTGAGWGGAVVVLAPTDREARVVAEIGNDFRERFGRAPEIWGSRAASGARREAVPG
ncbi:MAG TPA: galactokinase family protein [Gemmatimonadales bacterium]|nr:galactokinase family protein [Gemmatimonadales bacterium]